MLPPRSLRFEMLMMGRSCFSSPGQWRLETKEVLDFSVLKNCLHRSGLLPRHLDQETVYCKRWFCEVVLYDVCLQSPTRHSLHLEDLPPAGSLSTGSKSARVLLSLDGRCCTRTKPETDACLTSSQGKDPCLRCLPLSCAKAWDSVSQDPLCLWHPNLPVAS